MAQNLISLGTSKTDFGGDNLPIFAPKVSNETFRTGLRCSLKNHQNSRFLRERCGVET